MITENIEKDINTRNALLADELSSMILELQRSFVMELFSEVSQYDISITQYTLLSFLDQSSDGLSMSQIAKLMRHAQSTATGVVFRLGALGMIERGRCRRVRRSIIVRITEKGRLMLEKMKQSVVRNIQSVSKEISQKDLESWVKVYRRLQAVSDTNGPVRRLNRFRRPL